MGKKHTKTNIRTAEPSTHMFISSEKIIYDRVIQLKLKQTKSAVSLGDLLVYRCSASDITYAQHYILHPACAEAAAVGC